MSVKKEEVLKYLADIRAHYTTYHNHKEATAWAGVLLYVALMAQVVVARNEILDAMGVRPIFTIAVVPLVMAIVFFLKTQFGLRRLAANYTAACIRLASEYLCKNDAEIAAAEWGVVPLVPSRSDSGSQSEYVLPKVLKETADRVGTVGQQNRITLERASYVLVVIITLLAVLRLWLPYFFG